MNSKRRLKKSRLKLGITFILLVAALLAFGRLWQTAGQSLWLANEDFSWVDQEGNLLTVYSIIPEYDKLITWPLPDNVLADTAGYGLYQLKNVYALGEIESKGGAILTRTVQETLGIGVKGWRVGKKTNLSWLDRFKRWYYLQFKVKRRVTLDLSQNSAWQEAVLADGSRVLKPVDFRLDQAVNGATFSQEVAAEDLSLSLVNGSRLSRVISNHGIQVVNVSSSSSLSEKTILYVKDGRKKDSHTVTWIKWLLPQAEVKQETLEDQWSDLVLVIGKDYN